MRDKGLKGAAGGGRRVLPPQIVDEPVGRDRVPPGDDEQGQHRALSRAAQIERFPVKGRAHLAQDGDSQPRPVRRRVGHRASSFPP
jgi:hypothetical protein